MSGPGEPTLEEALVALEVRIDRALEAGEGVRAAEAGVLLGYLLGASGHPGGRERAARAAATLNLASELERPLRIAAAWGVG